MSNSLSTGVGDHHFLVITMISILSNFPSTCLLSFFWHITIIGEFVYTAT